MKLDRSIRALFLALAAYLTFAPPMAAANTNWPNRPVRIVLGVSPGSGSDLLARAIALELAEVWKQPVIVDNKPGASGIIAASSVAKAPADGTTLLLAIDANITTNPHVFRSLPYDPVKDFAPVTMLMTFSTLLVAHPSVPFDTVEQLVARAKSNPGELSYASLGEGSNMHLLSATLEHGAGVKLMQVSYKGVPQMTNAIMSGEVQMGWLGTFTAKPLIAEGRLKPIGISGSKRSNLMPQVPTFAESKYSDVDVTVWYGLLAPAATPAPIVNQIHEAVMKIIAKPAFREQHLLPKGYEPGGMGTKEFGEHIQRELVSRGRLAKQAGVKLQD